jgi:DNA-binding NtrC family response regulator
MKKIIYYDIEALRLGIIRRDLEKMFQVLVVPCLNEVRKSLVSHTISAVVLGIHDSSPAALSKIMSETLNNASCPLVMLLDGVPDHRLESLQHIAFVLPEDIPRLGGILLAAISKSGDTEVFEPIFLTRSGIMKKVDITLRKYAQSGFPVLIMGETGTGKEVAANAIHSLSDRRQGPFIALNCSAIPDTLFESELFGTEKGAYTDALQHPGALVRASGGTLFLDEVGAMSKMSQPKLLRALDSGCFWRLGAKVAEKSDFRLVCATCENLLGQTAKDSLRKDLLYRISDLVVVIPPLRDRIDDIPLLAEYFCREASKGHCELSENALERLKNHLWHGNVRELKSVIHRACANVQSGNIGAEDIIFISWFSEKDYPIQRLSS